MDEEDRGPTEEAPTGPDTMDDVTPEEPKSPDQSSEEGDMPRGSHGNQGSPGQRSHHSHGSASSHVKFDDRGGYNPQYHGAEAWWSVGEFLHPGITHQSIGLSLVNKQDDDTWDLSDSLADLYREVNKKEQEAASKITLKNHREDHKVDVKNWISQDTSHGFVRVFYSDSESNSRLFPCILNTTAQKICFQCAMPPNSLHVQLYGDIIRRVEPFDCPLAIQNEYLQRIGYTDLRRVQEAGSSEDLFWLVKFYAGKPISDSTYSRNQLLSWVHVRKGKLIYQWVRRLCAISGTRLMIHRGKSKTSPATTVQLAKGSVEETQFKGHEHCLKLTSSMQGDRSVYLSFADDVEYSKWLRKAKKATAKLPTKADLSNCHLEYLPETVFINEDLRILNLRHNVLKERPIEEDIYTIGWLDDLPRFYNLRSLNLADNDLHTFPLAVCRIHTLTELNMASNKLDDLPADIVKLHNLKILHAHNNHLTTLPEEMNQMRHLMVLVLAFNHFTTVPSALLHSHDSSTTLPSDSLIMAGNLIEKLTPELLNKMRHVKKIDFRMNKLCLLPSETAKFHVLENVTHLDIRDNQVTDLDVRVLKSLEYLNCERNGMHSLQINGASIKNIFASHNELETFLINPKPEWLVHIDVSYNKLTNLQSWLTDCFFLVQLNASHNLITDLPARFLAGVPRLRSLFIGHNNLHTLPSDIEIPTLEELHLDQNQLTDLPTELFVKGVRLRVLKVTGNKLTSLPEPNGNVSLNKLQELYASVNKLTDADMSRICCLTRLHILHLAHNEISEIAERDIQKLELLQELNISGNHLRRVPKSLGHHPKLQVLRANSNLLKELPDFRNATYLKVLEVGSNHLVDVNVTNLMTSQVNLLDISGNPNLMVDTRELKGISNWKKICMVDMRGQNRSLLNMRTAQFENLQQPWQSGLSQTSGIRNRLSVSVINKPWFSNEGEGLFGIFDGGLNDEVAQTLLENIGTVLNEEAAHPITGQQYMKYTMLTAHRKLKSTGQKIGAAAALCHIKKADDGSGHFVLNVANVGDVEVIISRRGEAICLSRHFAIPNDKEECRRIFKSDGIITEDGRINGVTYNTRLLGCSYLFPFVTPDPHVSSTTLHPEDQLVILASQGLWKYMTYQEAINEVMKIPDPVVAAKHLQDLAQGYGSRENIAILIVRLLLTEVERFKMKNILQNQFEAEQQLLARLRERDVAREELRRKKAEEELAESVPMDIVKLKEAKKRGHVIGLFPEEEDATDGVKVKPLLRQGVEVEDWEAVLQKRLTEEVKNKELRHTFHGDDGDIAEEADNINSNWATLTKKSGKKVNGHNSAGRVVAVPPPALPTDATGVSPTAPGASVESLAFKKEYALPTNVDRDAILFHQMQMTRAKNHGVSNASMDSTVSEPMGVSVRDVKVAPKASSHSIEVLIHSNQPSHAEGVGGSCPASDPNKGIASLNKSKKQTPVTRSYSESVPKETDKSKSKTSSKSSKKRKNGRESPVCASEKDSNVKDVFILSGEDFDDPTLCSHVDKPLTDSMTPLPLTGIPDVNSNSITSLEDIKTWGKSQSNGVKGSDPLVSDVSSTDSLLTKSLSQQSVIITYL